MLKIASPPLPAFLASGEDTYSVGQSHVNRVNLGCFDLLIVSRGCLFLGEEEKKVQGATRK